MRVDPLFIDVYPGDGRKDWRAFCAAGLPWAGAIFKASQGLRFRYDSWLGAEHGAFIAAAGDRYGRDLFDGFYHFLDLNEDGADQAELFVQAVTAAGGEDHGTLWGMVDVERGGQTLKDPSRAQVEDCTRAFAARYSSLTGRTPTLYGGELLRAVGVSDRLWCGRSAIALYGATLPASLIARTGTDLAHLLFWQYRGTDHQAVGPADYPMIAPGCGVVDISAMVLPGGLQAMRSQLWAEAPAA